MNIENCKVDDCHKRELVWEIERLRADISSTIRAVIDDFEDELTASQRKFIVDQIMRRLAE